MAKSSTKEADTGYLTPNQSEKDVKSKIVTFRNHFRIRQDRDIENKIVTPHLVLGLIHNKMKPKTAVKSLVNTIKYIFSYKQRNFKSYVSISDGSIYFLHSYVCLEPAVKIQMETVCKERDIETKSTERNQKLFDNMTKPQILSNIINNVFNLHGCTLLWFETGSLNFYVQCESAEGLESIWQRINDGTLAEQLQDVLLTESVLDGEDVSCLYIETTMDEREHQEAYEKYVELGKKSAF